MSADLKNLSIEELKKLDKIKTQELKDKYNQYKEQQERQKLIERIKKKESLIKKINVICKRPLKNKKKSKPKPKTKTFDEYFQECIKNKSIPPDTPSYLRKALERAIKEHEQGIIKEKSALDGFANKYIVQGKPGIFPFEYFKSQSNYLKDFLRNHRNIKVRFVLVCLMEKKEGNFKLGFTVQDKAFFHSDTHTNLESTDVKQILVQVIRTILDKITIYQHNGSGWYFKEVVHLEIHTVNFNPMRGSSYIPLPDWIMRKKAIVNIRNNDDKCFLWCVLRYLNPKPKNDDRYADLKEKEFALNTKGISFPMKVRDIKKFEDLNPSIPGINVFSVNENNKFYPLREAKRNPQETIDLFLYEEDGRSHYSLIKHFYRLFRSQITSRTNGKIFICKKCFTHFSKEGLFQKHIEYCSTNETVAVKMPLRNTMLHFKNYQKQLPIPFVVYADFECFTKPMNTCSPNPEDSYNYNYQKHEPSGFCFYIKGIVPNTFEPIIYTKTNNNDNVPEIFVSKLSKITHKLYNDFYRRPRPLKLTKQEQALFDQAKTCHICSKELLDDKVRDHCHFSGQYRGAAHNSCNLQCRKPMILPVVFHNLQGYDAHLFIRQLSSIPGELNCIPSTEEKYISFSKKIKVDEYKSKRTGETVSLYFEIRFIDSFKFLQTSLANLVGNL